jgi:hypothetical protein
VAEELAVTRPDLVSVVVISLAARPASMYEHVPAPGFPGGVPAHPRARCGGTPEGCWNSGRGGVMTSTGSGSPREVVESMYAAANRNDLDAQLAC